MQIQQYEERLRVAMLLSDVAALDELIDDDLLFVGPGGGIHTKEDDLQLHRSGAPRMSQADWLAVEVRNHGAACITVLTAQLSGTFPAELFSGMFRYFRTWAEREGAWRVEPGSVSVIAAEDLQHVTPDGPYPVLVKDDSRCSAHVDSPGIEYLSMADRPAAISATERDRPHALL